MREKIDMDSYLLENILEKENSFLSLCLTPGVVILEPCNTKVMHRSSSCLLQCPMPGTMTLDNFLTTNIQFLCTNSNVNVLVAGSNTMETTFLHVTKCERVEPGGNKQDTIVHK
jgi:hypothetical protein